MDKTQPMIVIYNKISLKTDIFEHIYHSTSKIKKINIDIKKNKLAILDFATPEVHKTNNSFCRSNLIMVNNIASKKLNGINFVIIFVKFRSEYIK